MWLSRYIYDDLRNQLASTTATRDALFARVQALDTTFDWFRVRITQLEHERALMLQNYLGVTVPTLSIEKVPSPTSVRPSYDAVPHFKDMGDTEAKAHGIDWNPLTGEISYPEEN